MGRSIIFYRATACNAKHGKAFLSVCPSDCLSNACFATKRRKLCQHSYTTWKSIYFSFLIRRMVGGVATRSIWNFGPNC